MVTAVVAVVCRLTRAFSLLSASCSAKRAIYHNHVVCIGQKARVRELAITHLTHERRRATTRRAMCDM